ncbi:UNVERIFIED_CONTAM: protein XRI1 [Sesamum radiatum]|uniref:Protein XRI1 n=1 Tax=Sesamum radiatum TaxID=300843 RepID=A0AAW2JRF2_SESRA
MDSISSPPNSHDHVSFLDDDDHDFSTGYLQDVLFEFSSKRRRLLMFADHHHDGGRSDVEISSMQNCWTSNLIQNCCQEFDSLTQITKSSTDVISEMKRGEEQTVSESYEHYSSSSSSQKEMSSADNQWTTTPEKRNLYCIDDHDTVFSSGTNEKRKKRVLAKVVYPFALVKPGGFEGDVTLNDINERILMPPTRPVRHPVGDFACRPLVSPDGPGLSGKAVVAFTRIQTQGRGTITIIRTRG